VGKGVDPNGPYWEPYYKDPVFLDKLDRFLAAMAKRYDGNPNVAFIDIGSFGVWGEGHSWASSKLRFDFETRKVHVELYCKHFKHTLLAISEISPARASRGRIFRSRLCAIKGRDPAGRQHLRAGSASLVVPRGTGPGVLAEAARCPGARALRSFQDARRLGRWLAAVALGGGVSRQLHVDSLVAPHSAGREP
jgi:hypothetical protein